MSQPENLLALDRLLADLRRNYPDERVRGTLFENLIQAFFRLEPFYQDHFSQVWAFPAWAHSRGLSGQDRGVDLVAEIAGERGLFSAIQCKFHQDDHPIQKSDINSFLAESGRPEFVERILVTTTTVASSAQATLEGQSVPCWIVDRLALANSLVDWSRYNLEVGVAVARPKKTLRPHQVEALTNIRKGFQAWERGTVLMACGSGKSYLSLKVAEAEVGAGGLVLFLVPSLALLSQILTEWTQEASLPLHSYAVCSDAYVGRLSQNQVDDYNFLLHELQFPATTKAGPLVRAVKARRSASHLTTIFSTYQSIEVLAEAQKVGLPEFDLIICDEAHRTTGSTFVEEEDSSFVLVHDNDYIRARKRLYMTATPKIFAVNDKKARNAETDTVVLFSMDDKRLFGPVFHSLSFSEAVKRGLLVDYKVLVLSMDESLINRRVKLLTDADNTLIVNDAARIVGCFKALAKHGLNEDLAAEDLEPMKRAVAFCQVIDATGRTSRGLSTHKVSSKMIESMFAKVVKDYLDNSADEDEGRLKDINCVVKHVDGTMNATQKNEIINWLREEPPKDECRLITNVRCMSEGLDIPALDAVLFLAPRRSMVEVTQSVGRVMRLAPGKKLGYVVLPVVIPAGVEPHLALNDNKTYKVVWDVLQALRSHDNRFDAWINKLELLNDTAGKIDFVTFFDPKRKSQPSANCPTPGTSDYPNPTRGEVGEGQRTLEFSGDESFRRAIIAKLVKKVGNPNYLDQWADDVVRIARTYIDRIKAILEDPKNSNEIQVFQAFVEELKDDLNDSLSADEVVEMLAQHMITGPAFEAIFANNSFIKLNPVSISINKVLAAFASHHLEKEAISLTGFYDSIEKEVENMREKVSGVDNILGKQKIIIELYDKFFRKAFPKMTQRLGIVYTPVEVVDFILLSVNDLLHKEFGLTLGSKNVNIIDPFVGTGTFITRLLQSGLIDKKDLPYKYKNEIHANEIVLLAYYIASINIESVYHELIGGDYVPFPGICLTDTFQLYEKDDLISRYLEDNSTRRKLQKQLPIRVIIGNPPYSIGQRSQNDSNKNIEYPILDQKIHDTYAAMSSAQLVRGTRDNYVRAFRWASDRLRGEQDGVVAFITNSGYVEKPSLEGIRVCFSQEFQSIYVFNLRGDIRKNILSGGRAGEGENIFGQNSMTGIAITFLVKNSQAKPGCRIYYHDIGDNLDRLGKLEVIKSFGSINAISRDDKWTLVKPDGHGDWIRQRNYNFNSYLPIGFKSISKKDSIFINYSNGIVTSRDVWCYNFSYNDIIVNIKSTIDFYNHECIRFNKYFPSIKPNEALKKVENFINNDNTKISWSRALKNSLIHNKSINFNSDSIVKSLYRPFTKSWLYFNRDFNEVVSQIPQLFPLSDIENIVICISGVGARCGFSVLAADLPPNLHFIDSNQCYPLYIYEPIEHERNLFQINDPDQKLKKRQAIASQSLKLFQEAYPKLTINQLDMFHYIYGLLHSQDYRDRFADNLTKELPRIPLVKKAPDFQAFVAAGKELLDLHLGYETAAKYPLEIIAAGQLTDADYYVNQMKFKKIGQETDYSTIIYNSKITLKGIPQEAFDYVVGGKPALAWVMKYQSVRVDKASGLVNDANIWATETMGDPKYPLELVQRVISVSLKTLDIVKSLPQLEI